MAEGERERDTGLAPAVAALAVVVIGAAALAFGLSTGTEDATHSHGSGDDAVTTAAVGEPARHTGPQGPVGQFVAACTYSHSLEDDPIVHAGHPGRSHLHDFYGAVDTDAFSTADQLLTSPTTCDKTADTASYWQPALYDRGELVEPLRIQAYYRAAPGVDPAAVEPYPLGLELIAGDQTADSPQPGEATGWVCGSSTRLADDPPSCPESAPLHMVLTFPDCWDGERVRSEDFRSHAAYSSSGACPAATPVHVPQLTVAIKYPVHGPGHELSLASGSIYSAHGDFLNAWDPDGLEREIQGCIRRGVVCDLASNREEEAPFFHN